MAPHADRTWRPTLSEWQQQALQGTVIWFFLAVGIMLGWLAALLVAAFGSGNGVFGLGGSSAWLAMIANALMLACVVVGVSVTAGFQKKARRRVAEVLAQVPATEPVASAVLVRIAYARRGSDAHQLLYAAHPRGEAVRAVLVPVPQGYDLPKPGSGAWLVLNQQLPAFASYFPAAPEQHAQALDDPAFEKLTRVQRGLALPGRAYLVPLLIGLVSLLVSGIAFSAALAVFG